MTFGLAFMVSSRDSIVFTWWPAWVTVRIPEARSAVVATLSAALKAAINRRSVDTASTLESARLRSTIPRRSLISRGLVGSRLSQPYSTHFSKLILVSHQEYLLSVEYGVQEMIPARKFRLEFRDGIYGWIDRAADVLLDASEPRKYLVKRGLPNNQKIYVALRRLFLPCHRPIHKCHKYSLSERVQR